MSLGGLVNVFVCSVTLKDHSWAHPVKIFTCVKYVTLLPKETKASTYTVAVVGIFENKTWSMF
jgi:hypothetical protein